MKREPVAIYAAVVAALTAFLGVAGLTDRVPEDVVFWLGVALAVLTAAGGVLVRGQVSPLADNPEPRVDPPKVVPAPTDGQSRIQPPPPYSD